jgi:phosphoglycolate phosphatase-like HAD superfamily hydrolase
MRVYLFDVDGTLINAHGAGRLSLTKAMKAVYGATPLFEAYDTRGRTDPEIVSDVMHAAGVSDGRIRERLDACFDTYVEELERLIANGHPVDVMPGITEIVRALSARSDALVGLLTGNIEGGAQAKLRFTGLLPYFRIGAFGSDDVDRRRLPGIARERARALVGSEVPFHDLVIIGDTPLDIDCARACGAVAVAVATGQHRAEELAALSPDLLFSDFSDVKATLLALTRH